MKNNPAYHICLLAVMVAGVLVVRAAAAPPAAATAFTGAYTAEMLSVASGGLQRGSVYRGLLEAVMDADLARVVGAPVGTCLHASGLLPHGGDLSGSHLGDLQGASNLAAYDHPLLYELWLEGAFSDGRMIVRAGRLVADTDFAVTASGASFLNSSFGWPAFISANTRNTGPAFARSALGVFAELQLTRTVRIQAGVYDGDTFDDAGGDPARHPNGLRVSLSRDQGLFVVTEIILETEAGPAAARRPGSLRLGMWWHTADFAELATPARIHAGNHGVWLVAEQMLWRESGPGDESTVPQGLTAFVRIGRSPDDRNLLSHAADAGLSYTGLIPGRDTDTLGLGVAWARVSAGARRAERQVDAAVISDGEWVVELTYGLALGDRWLLVPDLQYIRHPGGSAAVGDAWVVGLRTRVTF
ncbi:MAG: carbohydrate porin [Lacunisphaera sp.]|nr:carbohydrate porin [Lacunisphaera sp.]